MSLEYSTTAVLMERPLQDLHQLQREDGPICLFLEAVMKGEKPDTGDVRREGPEAQRLVQLWGRLVVDNGLLKRIYEATGLGNSWCYPGLCEKKSCRNCTLGLWKGTWE